MLSVRASEFFDIFSDFIVAGITFFLDLLRNAVEVFGTDVTNSLIIVSFEPNARMMMMLVMVVFLFFDRGPSALNVSVV